MISIFLSSASDYTSVSIAVNETTFNTALREVVGITEWPCVQNSTTKASCAPKTQINMAPAASSFGSLNADDLTSCL